MINKSVKHSFLNRNTINLIVVFTIPVILYFQTVSFGFTNFDDDLIIASNSSFLRDFHNIKQAFVTDAFVVKKGTFYRPLQTLSYMVDIHISGDRKTWMFHLTNVLLIGLIACVLYLFLIRLLIPQKLATLATLLFCVHPLFVSSVAWIPARGDMLLNLFSLLSLLFLHDYLQRKTSLTLILHCISFALALFCKETAIVLPILFILFYVSFSKEFRFEKRFILFFAMYLVSILVWSFLRSKAIDTSAGIKTIFSISSFIHYLQTYPESIARLIIPFNLAPIPSFSVWRTAVGVIILGLLTVFLVIRKEKPMKEKLFWLAWFFLFITPPMLYKNELIDYLDHRFFLPLIGLYIFMLSMIPLKWIKNGDISKPLILIVFIGILGIMCFVKARAYINPVKFYSYAVEENNRSVLAYTNRATMEEKEKNFQTAIDDYSHLTLLTPNDSKVYLSLGFVKQQFGDNKGAIEDCSKAIKLKPNVAKAYYLRGVSEDNIKDSKGALEDFDKAISLQPNYAQAFYARGNIKFHKDENQSAIEDFKQALKLNSKYLEAEFNIGIICINTQNYQEAIKSFSKVIELNSSFWDAYSDRAIAEYLLQNYTEAINDCKKVLVVKPNDPQALNYYRLALQDFSKSRDALR